MTFMAGPKPCLNPRAWQCPSPPSAPPAQLKLWGLHFRAEAQRRQQWTGGFTFPSALPAWLLSPRPSPGVSSWDRAVLAQAPVEAWRSCSQLSMGWWMQPRSSALSCVALP